LLEHLKLLANKRDVPYQSLLKIFLLEKVQEELKSINNTATQKELIEERLIQK